MKFAKATDIDLQIPRKALETVFAECDRYDADETGGRILGTYKSEKRSLAISVNGIIEPGPSAQRTATYFQQDGTYQERIFRQVEEREPSVEHLGNWHTHHVNGLQHLSGGDIETYRRTVEHRKHNTDFFLALLVTEKRSGKVGLDRYVFKNYMLRRGDDNVYEIPSSAVILTDSSLVWPASISSPRRQPRSAPDTQSADRVFDHDVVSQFYPNVKTFQSSDLGIYWRGKISLIDGSELEVVVIQDSSGDDGECSVTLRNPANTIAKSAETLSKQTFSSCRAALVATERMCNAELFGKPAKAKRGRGHLWIF